LLDGRHVGFEITTGAERWSQGNMQWNSGVAVETGVPGRLLLPKSWPGVTMLVDLETGMESNPELTNEIPVVAALSPDRRTLALLPNHRRVVHAMVWSPDGQRLASASADNTVRIWHVERGIEILTAWRGECNDLAVDAHDRLWLACADGLLRVIDGSPKENLTAAPRP
jgi:WD40 repeat protein